MASRGGESRGPKAAPGGAAPLGAGPLTPPPGDRRSPGPVGSDRIGPDGETRGSLSVLNIKLSSPFGEAHFEAPAAAIANFLDRTYRIVRMGKESDAIDFDAELNGLLWQA